jgi:hypothetical protein
MKHFRGKKGGSLPFRAEEFHLSPRPEIEYRILDGRSSGMADIGIARRQVKRVGDLPSI